MKTELEPQDIKAIVEELIESLKPVLSSNGGNGRHEDDGIFDVKELADYLSVSPSWIYNRTHLKEIPHLKIDGQLRFRKRDIDKWLNAYNVPAVPVSERIVKVVK
jgi:excisionase family DNA binding protein